MDNSSQISTKVKVIYSNCQKKKSATQLLSTNAKLNNIIAVTEPWIGKKCKATFKSPWKIHCNGTDSRAILVTPPWADAFSLSNFSDRDSVFCSVTIDNTTLIIGVIYVEGGYLDSNWAEKFTKLKNICPRIIIFSDSNAHSRLWGYNTSDKKGESWEEVLALAGLEVFTDKYVTTFQNSRKFQSCIDIAFGTPITKPLFSDRIMDVLPSLSDHKVWEMELNLSSEISQSVQLKLKSVDWDNFNKVLEAKLESLKWYGLSNR